MAKALKVSLEYYIAFSKKSKLFSSDLLALQCGTPAILSSNANSHTTFQGMAHKGLWLHLEQSFEHINYMQWPFPPIPSLHRDARCCTPFYN